VSEVHSHPQPFSRQREKGVVVRELVLSGFHEGADLLDNLRSVLQYQFISETDHLQASSLEFSRAFSIVRSGFERVVNAAVKFDDQSCLSTVKIHDVTLERFLSQKPRTLDFRAAQLLPQQGFCGCLVFSVLSLQFHDVIRRAHRHDFSSTLRHPIELCFLLPLSRPRERGLGGESS
jgi:hypothetical protein